MKSKKIILCFVIAIFLICGIAIWKISSNTTSNQEEASQTSTDVANDSNNESTNDSNAEDNNNNNDAESKDNSSNNELPKDSENSSNNQGDTAVNKLSGKDAVTSILKHFVGENEVKSQHIIPIALNGQVAKAEENNTTFYCDSKELNDSTKTGLIIILDSYDESHNSYKYTLKDYHAIVNGKDASMGAGTVSGDGSVTEE